MPGVPWDAERQRWEKGAQRVIKVIAIGFLIPLVGLLRGWIAHSLMVAQ
jgi:hypothetical protein